MDKDTPIEVVIDNVLKKLGKESYADFNLFTHRDEWINTCKQNLIFSVGALCRLSSKRLARLQLPLGLEEEFERIVEHANSNGASSVPSSFPTGVGGCPFLRNPNRSASPKREAPAPLTKRKSQAFNLNLSAQQKQDLRRCWQQLQGAADGVKKFSTTFYPMFFNVNPAGQRLFKNRDMQQQGRVLMAMLGWIMKHLDDTNQLLPVLAQMGGRHELYGVVFEDYKAFANAIARALRVLLGEDVVTDDMFKTWETCVTQMAELMIRAAKEVKSGYRGQLMRQRASNGAWVKTWVNLTLDTLYIFNDKSYTQMRAPYSLRSVEGITFPESISSSSSSSSSNPSPPQTPHLFMFELVSTNPPFTVQLGSESKDEFESWVGELDWRIRAIQRVYSSSGDSDSESEIDPSVKNLAVQTQKTRKRVAKKKAATKPSETTITKSNIALTETQKIAIKSSWKLLCEKEFTSAEGSEKALARFYDEFYPKFFEINPVARRLFQEEGMMVQIRALVKMLSSIVKLLDSPVDLQTTLSRLGGRHEIYGVEAQDYLAFAKAIGESLKVVLGKDCTDEIRDSWFKVMMEVSVVMQTAGKALRTTPLEAVIFRKVRRTEWKKSLIRLNLETLCIYKDTRMAKLKANIPLGDVRSVDLITDSDGPTQHGFVVETSVSHICFCCDTKEECLRWVEEIDWRIKAVSRAYESDEGSSSISLELMGKKKSTPLFPKKRVLKTS